jgi:hypothetical protein
MKIICVPHTLLASTLLQKNVPQHFFDNAKLCKAAVLQLSLANRICLMIFDQLNNTKNRNN